MTQPRQHVGLIVASFLGVAALSGCGSWSANGQAGITQAKPTSAQLKAMSRYFVSHIAAGEYGSASHIGCVTYSMGTSPRSDHGLLDYTQVDCQACTASTAMGGLTPVVFALQGAMVVSAQADTEPGEPMFSNVINQIFPPSLRSAANQQQVPDLEGLVRRASALSGC